MHREAQVSVGDGLGGAGDLVVGVQGPHARQPLGGTVDALRVPRAAQFPRGDEHQVRAHGVRAILAHQVVGVDDVPA